MFITIVHPHPEHLDNDVIWQYTRNCNIQVFSLWSDRLHSLLNYKETMAEKTNKKNYKGREMFICG
jgi:hypothetical protein